MPPQKDMKNKGCVTRPAMLSVTVTTVFIIFEQLN